MGGLLFNLPRMPRESYLAIEAEIRRHLDRALPDGWRIPRHYGDKPDFGDLDVLVANRPDWEAIRGALVRELGITETKAVGHVYSTVFRGLQTDFFTIPARYLESTYDFMSFNDLGNFVGRICRRFDLKYGEKGLTYVYRRTDGRTKTDLEVSRDFGQICAFLGLDHAAWLEGFPSLPAVYAWVTSSPYFSVAPYLDDEKGSIERRKDRTTVVRFVEWLRENKIDQRPRFEERAAYLPQVIAAFPEARLDEKIESEKNAEIRQRVVAAKFSGKRVMELVPGLTGKALGDFVIEIRRSVEDFDAYAFTASQEEIDQRILDRAASIGRTDEPEPEPEPDALNPPTPD